MWGAGAGTQGHTEGVVKHVERLGDFFLTCSEALSYSLVLIQNLSGYFYASMFPNITFIHNICPYYIGEELLDKNR